MTATATHPRIGELTIEQFKELSAELLIEHHSDVEGLHSGRKPSDLDWEAYERLESAGMVTCLGAFVEGNLVGYSISFSPRNSLRYMSRRLMQCDMFFVSKPWRGMHPGFDATIGNMLRDEMLRAAAALNAELMWRAKPGSPMAFWLERHGCSMEEIVYLEDS